MYVQVSRTHAHAFVQSRVGSGQHPGAAQSCRCRETVGSAQRAVCVWLCGCVALCVCVCVCVFSYLVARHASVEVVNVMVLDTSREEFEDLLCT